MQLMIRLKEIFHTNFSLARFLQRPTIAGLVQEMAIEQQDNHLKEPLIPFIATPRGTQVQASFMQESFWFTQQLDVTSPLLNLVHTLHLQGPLNRVYLQDAIQTIMNRHEILRTSFNLMGSQITQVIHDNIAIPIVYINLSSYAFAERENRANTILKEEIQTPFNLELPPLFRIKIVQIEARKHQIIINWHHIIADGWSETIFLHELGALYNAYLSNTQPTLTQLDLQYADYALWQRTILHHTETLRSLENYWQCCINKLPQTMSLPKDKTSKSSEIFSIKTLTFHFSSNLELQINDFCKSNAVTPFILLLAIFEVLLYRFFNQKEVVIRTPLSQREHPTSETLLGCCINVILLHATCDPSIKFDKFLNNVKQSTLEALHHCNFPYQQFLELFRTKSKTGLNAVSPIMFAIHNHPTPNISMNNLEATYEEHRPEAGMFQLSVELINTPTNMTVLIGYNSNIFYKETIFLRFTFLGSHV